MKILLVGLDGPVADVAGGWLREGGHEVAACPLGEERLCANRFCPDLVLIRVKAAEALTQFIGWLSARQRIAGARVVAILSEDGRPGAIDCLGAGAADVLTLPLTRGELGVRLDILRAEGGLRAQLARVRGEALTAHAELKSAQKAISDARALATEAEQERVWLAKDLERTRSELQEKAARAAELDKSLSEITVRLEKTLDDLSAETKRASALLADSGRSAALEKEVNDLRAALSELHEKHREAEAKATADAATADALDKARSELRALRVELGEAQRLPIRLFEATGPALSAGLVLLEKTAGDEEPKAVYTNPTFELLTGRKRSEQVGQTLWFSAADVNLDWRADGPIVFHREEPKEDGGSRRLRIEVMAVPGIVGGRSLWSMVLREEVTEVLMSAQVAPEEKVAAEGPASQVTAVPRKVLLARDGGPLNPRLVGVLRDSGFQVSIGEPNSGVMEKAQRDDFDLVVLEINRPGSLGPGMLRLMRQHLPDQKVMVVSRLLTLRQKQEVERLHVSTIVTEELSGSELLKRIEQVLASADPSPGDGGMGARPAWPA